MIRDRERKKTDEVIVRRRARTAETDRPRGERRRQRKNHTTDRHEIMNMVLTKYQFSTLFGQRPGSDHFYIRTTLCPTNNQHRLAAVGVNRSRPLSKASEGVKYRFGFRLQ
ncbi:hypothetical protein GWI33_010921 [Rhynchophorus ferrugineus]|uniref:Uncharacterized protein n=1 Tax=Rhynchophorus ferrugineus TaxID=354439 RepID=A0A834M7L2_RHYFE|nr:hypothetical protein GWI33_012452 [Rhynchophorus ferrugineus]KAF7276101.1 hypothetical protein GWI33_010921 [Rhynchophorus ferrugineus]